MTPSTSINLTADLSRIDRQGLVSVNLDGQDPQVGEIVFLNMGEICRRGRIERSQIDKTLKARLLP